VTSQIEILAVLEDLDGKKFDVITADVEKCVREGERRMEKGFSDGAMMLLERNVLFGQIGDTDVWKTEKDRARNDSSLREAVRRVVEKLKRDGRPDCGCGQALDFKITEALTISLFNSIIGFSLVTVVIVLRDDENGNMKMRKWTDQLAADSIASRARKLIPPMSFLHIIRDCLTICLVIQS